jgi:hypothetical protein
MLKAIAALAVAVALAFGSVTCPLDDMMMIWTGQTRSAWGKLLYEYRCPAGHASWVVQ